jgi:hypothetical protein
MAASSAAWEGDSVMTTRREFFAMAAQATRSAVPDSFVSERRELKDPGTGRRLVQLTSGDCFDMPMYYFIPTFVRDGKSIAFYRYRNATGEIQLYRLDVDTGATVRLTNATTPNSLWRPYMQLPGFGVRDLLSAVNPVTNEAVYFDRNVLHAVDVETLKDRVVARLPEDRVPCGLTGVSPSGTLFCFPHAERKWWDRHLAENTEPSRAAARDARLEVVDLRTGKMETVLSVNFWITHANFYDDHRILFCHDATDYAILLTDLRDPLRYENVRARSGEPFPVHYHATDRGIAYEVVSRSGPMVAGFYNPDTRFRREYRVALDWKQLHIGRDPLARLWFFETIQNGKGVLAYLPELRRDALNRPVNLTGGSLTTYSNNQRSHFHPGLTPDRKWILFTGGDSRNRTNHLFLLDVADLEETKLAD